MWPETILDTGGNSQIRLFLLRYFRIEAVISLPYDAFRPFTSTKTCIVLAKRRQDAEVSRWTELWKKHSREKGKSGESAILAAVMKELGWLDEMVFMAEPKTVGYKRRKNLPDLPMPNQLYDSVDGVGVNAAASADGETVLGRWLAGEGKSQSPVLGFWTSLREIVSRAGFRLDPKYRWLWDFQHGVAHGSEEHATRLSEMLELVQLTKLPKGDLDRERTLIDLEHVESRHALISEQAPIVDTLGSDKVSFEGCDLAISKLEPYLGKILYEPPAESIGSPEWIGLKIKNSMPKTVAAYLLMLPDVCEAYRRLQSGKRHARFDPEEFLQLKVQFPDEKDYATLDATIAQQRQQITVLRSEIKQARASIDTLLGCASVDNGEQENANSEIQP